MPNLFSKYGFLLTYLGILPFWLCTTAIVLGVEQDHAIFALRTYGAVIVSFISGIHWGVGMKDSQRKTLWLLATSNIIALLAWGSLFLYHVISAFIVLALALMALLYVDVMLYRIKQIYSWFISLRWQATIIVLGALAIAGWALS